MFNIGPYIEDKLNKLDEIDELGHYCSVDRSNLSGTPFWTLCNSNRAQGTLLDHPGPQNLQPGLG